VALVGVEKHWHKRIVQAGANTLTIAADNPPVRKIETDATDCLRKVQAHYHASPDITGAELYAFAEKAAADAGWRFGGVIAGHLASEFAHAQIPGDKDLNCIKPGNTKPMRIRTNSDGSGWILEIHLVEPNGSYGGFYERLL
jgi:Xaa-Pro dipeptidase